MDIRMKSRPVTLEPIYTALFICATSNKQLSESLLYIYIYIHILYIYITFSIKILSNSVQTQVWHLNKNRNMVHDYIYCNFQIFESIYQLERYKNPSLLIIYIPHFS